MSILHETQFDVLKYNKIKFHKQNDINELSGMSLRGGGEIALNEYICHSVKKIF